MVNTQEVRTLTYRPPPHSPLGNQNFYLLHLYFVSQVRNFRTSDEIMITPTFTNVQSLRPPTTLRSQFVEYAVGNKTEAIFYKRNLGTVTCPKLLSSHSLGRSKRWRMRSPAKNIPSSFFKSQVVFVTSSIYFIQSNGLSQGRNRVRWRPDKEILEKTLNETL